MHHEASGNFVDIRQGRPNRLDRLGHDIGQYLELLPSDLPAGLEEMRMEQVQEVLTGQLAWKGPAK